MTEKAQIKRENEFRSNLRVGQMEKNCPIGNEPKIEFLVKNHCIQLSQEQIVERRKMEGGKVKGLTKVKVFLQSQCQCILCILKNNNSK